MSHEASVEAAGHVAGKTKEFKAAESKNSSVKQSDWKQSAPEVEGGFRTPVAEAQRSGSRKAPIVTASRGNKKHPVQRKQT
ncbi:hypothetical protein NDU88_006527 [Pleurodeles waltl]|uniref:Uncharacterized protein n=1 Tax=Pleurodeles waltl TaxID=8319 RepID=A0AAV7MEB3_PLEWA|nr:hypothetical protein NDU88_006527 [Pleurodeles waltl]